MSLHLGLYRKQALQSLFRIAGAGGYAGSGGVTRQRVNAMLWRFRSKAYA